MAQLADLNICTGCTACAEVCPQHCIEMCPDEEGFLHPVTDQSRCIECGLCTKTCPILNPAADRQPETQAFAAIHKEDEVRLQSTSGGVFTALARWVFERDGVVFGAAYAEDFSVYHCPVWSEAELGKLRTAKYSQSRLEDIFLQVQKELRNGKTVLFSGTPCQVAGLRSFLRKPYDNLIMVDLVCHGVPSPKIWEHYRTFRQEQDAPDSQLSAVNLRSKETGWPGYSIRFEYEDGTVYSAKNNVDPYLRGFIGDYYLRPSCYECKFKGIARSSDFTLADYWGVWSQLPEYNDGKGTSLILVQSEKARQIWGEIQNEFLCQELAPTKSVEENPAAVKATGEPQNRAEFWKRYESENFSALITELLPPPPQPKKPSLLRSGLVKIKRIIKG